MNKSQVVRSENSILRKSRQLIDNTSEIIEFNADVTESADNINQFDELLAIER